MRISYRGQKEEKQLTLSRIFIHIHTGEYCIYKRSKTCPRGLLDGQVEWDDEDSDNQNKRGGALPQGTFQDSVSASTIIGFCCGTSGSKTSPINLPVESPFYLLAYSSKECQQVKWAVASLEWIHYDTENDNNYDAKFGHYPYGAVGGINGHTIHYCYYTSKYTALQISILDLHFWNAVGNLCNMKLPLVEETENARAYYAQL